MKSEGSIRHQLAQVIFRHRKKWVEQGLAKQAHNCVHNRRLALFGRTIGSCGYQEGTPEASRAICDVQFCPELARGCPWFQSKHTTEELKESFDVRFERLVTQARQRSGELAGHYPDVAALMWVLGDEDPPTHHDTNLPPPNSVAETRDAESPPPHGGSR